jgi:hypothetical protein
LKIGSVGDSPAPVGDTPTGTAVTDLADSPSLLVRIILPVPSAALPDGRGGSPVLPKNHFQNMLLDFVKGLYLKEAPL